MNPKPLCSVCKTVLLDEKDGRQECPNCHVIYYPSHEIMEYQDDDFSSSHSDEMPEIAGTGGMGAGIMAATDDQDPDLTSQLYKDPRKKPNEGWGAETWD